MQLCLIGKLTRPVQRVYHHEDMLLVGCPKGGSKKKISHFPKCQRKVCYKVSAHENFQWQVVAQSITFPVASICWQGIAPLM